MFQKTTSILWTYWFIIQKKVFGKWGRVSDQYKMPKDTKFWTNQSIKSNKKCKWSTDSGVQSWESLCQRPEVLDAVSDESHPHLTRTRKENTSTIQDTLIRSWPHLFLNLRLWNKHNSCFGIFVSCLPPQWYRKRPQLCFIFNIFTICYRVCKSWKHRPSQTQCILHNFPEKHKVYILVLLTIN